MKNRIMHLMRHGRGKWIAGAGMLALAFLFFLGWRFPPFSSPDSVPVSPLAQVPEVKNRHPLIGTPIEAPIENPFVYAVMIDQSVDAWPQSGVDQAFLVIEAPVEGDIPRWEAFFYEGQSVAKIGPVRSARPYFVDWVNELDGLYAHVGGSDAALKQIVSAGTFDLNQFWNGQYFWRAADRMAPHNVYTSSALLDKALSRARQAGAVQRPVYGIWTFKKDEPSLLENGMVVPFGSNSYKVTWVYDQKANAYARTQGAENRSVVPISAKNVVVIEAPISVLDDVGRKEIQTVGEGKARMAQDGRVIQGTWKKASVSERIRLYDLSGDEMTMNAGQTWIEVVSSIAPVVTVDQSVTTTK